MKTLNVGDREHSVAFLFEEHCHAVVFDAHDDADAPGLVLDVGIDGVIVNLPTHRYTPGVITKVGEALKPLIEA